jgi:Na+-translocating ferredoxin:NAD+ oxidoreductase RnfG subunit
MRHELPICSLLVPAVLVAAPSFAVDYLSVAQAQRALFPSADAYDARTLTLDSAQRGEIKRRAGTRQREETQQVWRARRGDELAGWLLVDNVVGKHEFITYATAIAPSGEVLGVEILSYRETHGGEVRETAWRENFVGKSLSDPLRLGRDVPNISGATLSCRNVTDGVRRLLVIWDLLLKDD